VNKQEYNSVIELDENDVPREWRSVLANDKIKIKKVTAQTLSKGYLAGIPKKI